MYREFLTHFTFDNQKCICEVERVVDDRTNKLVENLAIKKVDNKTIPMAYFYGEGLKISTIKNKSKNNILGEFLGIKKDDLTAYKSFFEKYGFLFYLENEHFTRIPIDKIDDLKNNLLAFVFLLNNQFEDSLDYKENNIKELLDATLYLIFKNESSLEIFDSTISKIEKNEIFKIIESSSFHNECAYNIKHKEVDGQTIEYFEIKDSLASNGINEIDIMEYNELLNSVEGHWFGNLCRVYKNKSQLISNAKYNLVVDFLFHFVIDYSIFSPLDISLDGTFDDRLYSEFKKNSKLLKALIEISKVILEDEFRNNLSNVTPTFNVKDMMPDWKLPSLYTALYFSLFYMNSKEENLRKCANPNCGQFFQVAKTNSIKKYCSILCTNSVSQRKYQRKQAQKKK